MSSARATVSPAPLATSSSTSAWMRLAARTSRTRRVSGARRYHLVNAFALFGMGGREKRNHEKEKLSTLADIEAEIAAAPQRAAQPSLADAVWMISKDIPLSLRDRVVCTVAAEAVQALCETGLDGASLVVTLALFQALKRNGFSKNVRAVAGFMVVPGGDGKVKTGGGSSGDGKGTTPTAAAHVWLEVDGRVLDVVSDGLALCEAARRAGIDYSDEPAMREMFGRDVLALGEYKPWAQRPLTVLNVPVSVGGSTTAMLPRGLTLKAPPASVPGAAEAMALVLRYQAVLRDEHPGALVSEMPVEVREVYERIAGIQLETVGSFGTTCCIH